MLSSPQVGMGRNGYEKAVTDIMETAKASSGMPLLKCIHSNHAGVRTGQVLVLSIHASCLRDQRGFSELIGSRAT